MAKVSKIDVCKLKRSEIWEYRIYIRGVGGYAESHLAYLSVAGARKAALRVGFITNLPVFDLTTGGKQIYGN